MPSATQDIDNTNIRTRPPKRDATYFLESIFFLVEDGIFQVPKHHFQLNDVFSTTFMLPPPKGQLPEGSSEKKPFELKGICKKDFQAFLQVLYPLSVPNTYEGFTAEEWQSVLRLSSMWEFQSLRDLAVQWLSKPGMLDSVLKMLLGEAYDLHEWFVAGCRDLVTRSKGPRVDEMEKLGLERTESLIDLREWYLRAQGGSRGINDVKHQIWKAFKDVLGDEPVTYQSMNNRNLFKLPL